MGVFYNFDFSAVRLSSHLTYNFSGRKCGNLYTKVKLTLCLNMNLHEDVKGSGSTAPLILNVRDTRRRTGICTIRVVHLRGNRFVSNLTGACACVCICVWGLQGRYGRGGTEKENCPCRESNTSRSSRRVVMILTEQSRLSHLMHSTEYNRDVHPFV